MKRAVRLALAGGTALVLSLGVAACGDSKDSGSTGDAGATGKQGGKLTYLAAGDIDYLDPGQSYYTFGFMVATAVNRTLYGFRPEDSVKIIEDLADGPPVIGADNKTVTVKIKKGVKYAPPVNREVKSADIKYAFERAFSKNVPNGYAGVYFSSIVGAPTAGEGDIKDISGITTPDDSTIVFTLKDPLAVLVANALVLPISTPVPKEYAAPFDAKLPSTYDEQVAFIGPYMVENDAKGKTTGWVRGKSLKMIRNPNWDKATDYRPAYLDEITIEEGNEDLATASRRTLSGTATICCDAGSPPSEVLGEALKTQKDQVQFIPSGGTRYIAFNTKVAPFDNANVRKAIVAVMDRDALRLTRGGELLGDIANGWIPPGIPGFEEAGGLTQNTDLDFLANPKGDAAVAKKYMDAAAAEGLPITDGKWTGGDKILTIATNADPGKKTAESFQGQVEALGFKLNFRIVPQDTLYTKFCGVPSQKVAICPNVGWFKDFPDPQAMLDATFNGKNILQQGNVNWPQLDVPAINDAMTAAALIPAGPERNKAWAAVNKQIAEQAPAIPWLWDKTAVINSKDVNSVPDTYTTAHALTFMSLK
jgi:peptide/nickel transport system substrate-binding protein